MAHEKWPYPYRHGGSPGLSGNNAALAIALIVFVGAWTWFLIELLLAVR